MFRRCLSLGTADCGRFAVLVQVEFGVGVSHVLLDKVLKEFGQVSRLADRRSRHDGFFYRRTWVV